MTSINNENKFREALKNLAFDRQRLVAARFIENVIALSKDERVARAIKVAADNNASQDELATALQTAKAATVDSHTRCGSEGDWTEQAGYFVARAAVAALTPERQKAGNPALHAAMNSRMAQTCRSIEAAEDKAAQETQNQYLILSQFLDS